MNLHGRVIEKSVERNKYCVSSVRTVECVWKKRKGRKNGGGRRKMGDPSVELNCELQRRLYHSIKKQSKAVPSLNEIHSPCACMLKYVTHQMDGHMQVNRLPAENDCKRLCLQWPAQSQCWWSVCGN